MSNKIIHTTDAKFSSDVTNSELPVLVDFWAPWCGPCASMAPSLDALAEELDGKVKIVKVNVDENMSVSSDFKIRGLPTLLLFKGGVVVATVAGSQTKSAIQEFIDNNIGV